MSMLRDLARGRMADGGASKPCAGIMLENDLVRLRCVLVYERPALLGYILTIENLGLGAAPVPPQQIVLPGLLAIASDKDFLEAGQEARAYMVVRR